VMAACDLWRTKYPAQPQCSCPQPSIAAA
jgi:hypothetical protein